MGRAYLDHASTSPARPEVVEAMLPWLAAAADPSRVHTEGRLARVVVENAREQVAALVGARPREVVFTSGATEAICAATFGAAARATRHSVAPTGRGAHIVCPAVEHSAVREASARHVVTEVGVDRLGRVDVAEVMEAVRFPRGQSRYADDGRETALVHLQWANHEVGTLQPVAHVAGAGREAGVLVHVDAAAAAGHVPVDFSAVGADLMSLSAHKLGGPQGVGALLVRRGLRLPPLMVGGEQERARRAGMENVAAIVGFGAAAGLLATGGLQSESQRARAQTDRATAAATAIEGVDVFGDPSHRVPHLVCFAVHGVEAEAVLLGLDQAGVAVHSGSACSSETLEPSPVLEAMGVEAERSLRVSVGWSTTEADVDAFCAALPRVVSRLRSLAAGT